LERAKEFSSSAVQHFRPPIAVRIQALQVTRMGRGQTHLISIFHVIPVGGCSRCSCLRAIF